MPGDRCLSLCVNTRLQCKTGVEMLRLLNRRKQGFHVQITTFQFFLLPMTALPNEGHQTPKSDRLNHTEREQGEKRYIARERIEALYVLYCTHVTKEPRERCVSRPCALGGKGAVLSYLGIRSAHCLSADLLALDSLLLYTLYCTMNSAVTFLLTWMDMVICGRR